MFYLNCAATSWPKPPCVEQAVSASLLALPCEGQRSSLGGGDDTTGRCRRALAALLGAKDPARIFFTSGATEAFNLALRGLPLAGRRVVVSATEHNAVLRPLYALHDTNLITVVPCDADGMVDPAAIADVVTGDTACVILNHTSNVTGTMQDIEAAGRAIKAKAPGTLFIVDAAQSAGAIPIDVERAKVDMLVFTGHKSLFGPTGTGGFWLRPGTPMVASKFGGTGTEGDSAVPKEPEIFEVGTQNLPGIAGLCAGAEYVLETGVATVTKRTAARAAQLRNTLAALPGVTVYGGGAAHRAGVISFNVGALSPADTAYILQHAYHIVVRSGFQCAPFIMPAIGAPKGVVRASFSHLTPDGDLEAFAGAVQEIAQGADT